MSDDTHKPDGAGMPDGATPQERILMLDAHTRQGFETRMKRLVAGLRRLAADCDKALGLPKETCNYYLSDDGLYLMAGETHTHTSDTGQYMTRPQECPENAVAYAQFPGTGGGW